MSDDLPKAPEEALPVTGTAPGEPEATHTGGTVPAPVPTEEPAPAPRRKGRTAALIAAAVALGLIGGACTGYLIQADREPTALPSLSQPELRQAGGEGPDPLPAAQDRKVRTDGDLRDLLLKTPKGKKEIERGWMSLAEYSATSEGKESSLPFDLGDEFRRAATVTWRESSTRYVEIRLVQYRHETVLGAVKNSERQSMGSVADGAEEYDIPGTGDGVVHVLDEPEREPGYMPQYETRASASRGDIALQMWVTDVRPLSKDTIMRLATQQMERL
ncbi:hypothetical protein [Streptomyces abyssomicinicus]|uniref:hypothetical protein n=1 Tax=Streptomyces abyssomicinicus TaxID=574929 RepID=UPI001FE728EC|nr:hypothetical protein [Streptomyces abyssomicinicus]